MSAPSTAATAENTVVRYVGSTEAQIAEDTGFIPNVNASGVPKTVFVTPEEPLSSAADAESAYQIGTQNPLGPGETPTHVIIGNAEGITFDYGGNVEGGTGIELTTQQRIPVIDAADRRPLTMSRTENFPKYVRVQAKGPSVKGLAIYLCFHMQRKNHFGHIVFLDECGVAEVPAAELLDAFDKERAAFLMDYVDPRTNFTGQVTARVFSTDELKGAVNTFEVFSRAKYPYEKGYEERLRSALARGQDPKEYSVEFAVG